MVLNKSFLTYSLVSAFFVFGTSGAFAWTSPTQPAPTQPAPATTTSPITTTTSAGPCCGNRMAESPEQCVDGNTIDGDGCSCTCQLESARPADAFASSAPDAASPDSLP